MEEFEAISRVPILEEPKSTPPPYWWNANRGEICYGVELRTLNPTDDAPWVIIYGTKGASEQVRLNNEAENFELGPPDYFLLSADFIGDVGIPTMIKFIPGGTDGWQFTDVRVDYYAGEGWKMREWEQSYKDWNNRDRALDYGSNRFALLTTTDFPGIGQIDSKGEEAGGIKYKQDGQLMKAEGASLDESTAGDVEVVLSSTYIIVEGRHLPKKGLDWDSSDEATVSGTQILRALRTKDRELTVSNKVTVGVKVGGEVGAPPAKETSEFSLQNEFSVTGRRRQQQQDETPQNLQSAFADKNLRRYHVDPGDVAFFELSKTAVVKTYSDFALFRRVSPAVSVNYNLVPTYFRTDEASGELRLLNVTYATAGGEPQFHFGDELKDPSQKRFLDATQKGWPERFSTHTAV